MRTQNETALLVTKLSGGPGFTWHDHDLDVLRAALYQLVHTLDTLELSDGQAAARARQILMQLDHLTGVRHDGK